MADKIYGVAEADLNEVDPQTGRNIVKLTFPDKTVIRITTNLGELIGGVSTGLRLRQEDAHVKRH
jgi:hypothetical protein